MAGTRIDRRSHGHVKSTVTHLRDGLLDLLACWTAASGPRDCSTCVSSKHLVCASQYLRTHGGIKDDCSNRRQTRLARREAISVKRSRIDA